MQFIYHKDAGDPQVTINGDLHKYLFKVRRQNKEEHLLLRNLNDTFLYNYQIINIDKKATHLSLQDKEEKIITNNKSLHIGWCVIDPKNIEKQIASLNEIGVEKITFIYCQYSQNKYKINLEKIEKLLINSSQQSGRTDIIKIEICNSLEEFLKLYPESYMFNFSSNHIDNFKNEIQTILIGCEGGFSDNEISKFDHKKIVGINSNIILKSETAIVTVASKIIL